MIEKTQLILGFMAALVRDSRSAVSRLSGAASPNTSDFYSDDYRCRPKDYTITTAASQRFITLSINIKATTSAQPLGQRSQQQLARGQTNCVRFLVSSSQ
jgi:hypothetical protein